MSKFMEQDHVFAVFQAKAFFSYEHFHVIQPCFLVLIIDNQIDY